ncbi:MAG: hypothetical protein CMH98_11300 [Oceanospirillaceae bacterium]|nr:hypothetical protein [Oceanospirillaceae bacterium]|tara:strand:- start:16726 stop:17103 length:378 start_codon:yes stop_codon:yes gene_type:complete
MNNFMNLIVLAATAFPFWAHAGCGEMDSRCRIYTPGETDVEIQDYNCHVVQCGNVYSIINQWELENGDQYAARYEIKENGDTESSLLINDKPAVSVPSFLLNDELSECVGTRDGSHYYCLLNDGD